jgi:hypothetical protein
MSVWKGEWDKFSDDAIKQMKLHSDKTHEEREWMCYVYDVDGTYELGGVSYGGESRIEVSPTQKAAQDRMTKGLRESDRKWTIHGHPLKDGKIYTGRQYFSSTDICREFVKSRDNDEFISQFLVYPHKQQDSATGNEVFHNRVRVLVFPNRQTIVSAMKQSNPSVNPMTITVESGQNQQVKKPDGSITLENQSGVDWFAFQEALRQHGCMGIVDLEGPNQGSTYFNSEGKIMASNLLGFAAIGIILFGLNKLRKQKPFSADTVQIVDDLAAYYH